MRGRRGFTLAELLVTMVILGVIGAALVRLILVQARFSEGQMALRDARSVSRNAMNIMLTDLRMVQDYDGLIVASKDSVTVRMPIAFGLLCATAPQVTMALVPVDSALSSLGVYAGWAYRDSVSGIYKYSVAANPAPINSIPNGLLSTCTDSLVGPGILPITVGGRSTRMITVPDAPNGTPNAGWPVFIYQRVTYAFDSSKAFPGRRGLFRRLKTASGTPISDEIVAPFDTSAKFRFYVLNQDTAQSAVPASLNDVRGLQLVLAGASVTVPRGSSQAKQASLVTGVFFKNRRDP
jgi:prepilin-type N-terminal cleavage/methylation domain-containing protein